jgi:hypothetical protein
MRENSKDGQEKSPRIEEPFGRAVGVHVIAHQSPLALIPCPLNSVTPTILRTYS